MDAVDFLKTVDEICCSTEYCRNCVLYEKCGNFPIDPEGIDATVKLVEAWKKRPRSLIEKIKYSDQWQNTKCPEWVYKLIEAEEDKDADSN